MNRIQPKAHLIVEGLSDSLVLNGLLKYADMKNVEMRWLGGKSKILPNLANYNEAAKYSTRWLVVLDLDHDAACAPEYVNHILPMPSRNMELRIAVRSIEAWLMADRVKMANFLGIPVENFPGNPDNESDPKRFLIDLIRRKCHQRRIREDMIPAERSGRKVGPGYSSQIAKYVEGCWRPEVAAQSSDSLARCMLALKNWSALGE
ncbi:MAG: hypothetical protein OXG25_01080 [Gammaproteobacteria bacterium]|nr:hypothetical protein [Gammaproteobacteria bacterium]